MPDQKSQVIPIQIGQLYVGDLCLHPETDEVRFYWPMAIFSSWERPDPVSFENIKLFQNWLGEQIAKTKG